VNFVLPDHLGERDTEFRSAHRACEGEHHFAAAVEVRAVTSGGFDERGGVKVAILVR
jgi:hypothetical protein